MKKSTKVSNTSVQKPAHACFIVTNVDERPQPQYTPQSMVKSTMFEVPDLSVCSTIDDLEDFRTDDPMSCPENHRSVLEKKDSRDALYLMDNLPVYRRVDCSSSDRVQKVGQNEQVYKSSESQPNNANHVKENLEKSVRIDHTELQQKAVTSVKQNDKNSSPTIEPVSKGNRYENVSIPLLTKQGVLTLIPKQSEQSNTVVCQEPEKSCYPNSEGKHCFASSSNTEHSPKNLRQTCSPKNSSFMEKHTTDEILNHMKVQDEKLSSLQGLLSTVFEKLDEISKEKDDLLTRFYALKKANLEMASSRVIEKCAKCDSNNQDREDAALLQKSIRCDRECQTGDVQMPEVETEKRTHSDKGTMTGPDLMPGSFTEARGPKLCDRATQKGHSGSLENVDDDSSLESLHESNFIMSDGESNSSAHSANSVHLSGSDNIMLEDSPVPDEFVRDVMRNFLKISNKQEDYSKRRSLPSSHKQTSNSLPRRYSEQYPPRHDKENLELPEQNEDLVSKEAQISTRNLSCSSSYLSYEYKKIEAKYLGTKYPSPKPKRDKRVSSRQIYGLDTPDLSLETKQYLEVFGLTRNTNVTKHKMSRRMNEREKNACGDKKETEV